MSAGEWIVVRNWERHQHPDAARSQVPPWIKLYTELLSDPAFVDLPPRLRGVLISLWIEYGRSRKRLEKIPARLSESLHCRVTNLDLERLNRAGWISFTASKPASNVASKPASKVASLEKRREELPSYVVGSSSLPSHSYPPERDSAEGGLALGLSDEVHRIAAEAAGNSHRPEPPPSPPPSSKSSSVFERAEAFTRQVGLEYPERDFLEELEQRFKALTPAERDRLFEIWIEVSPEVEPF